MADQGYTAQHKYCLSMTFCDCVPFILLIVLATGSLTGLSILLSFHLTNTQKELPTNGIDKKHMEKQEEVAFKTKTQIGNIYRENDNGSQPILVVNRSDEDYVTTQTTDTVDQVHTQTELHYIPLSTDKKQNSYGLTWKDYLFKQNKIDTNLEKTFTKKITYHGQLRTLSLNVLEKKSNGSITEGAVTAVDILQRIVDTTMKITTYKNMPRLRTTLKAQRMTTQFKKYKFSMFTRRIKLSTRKKLSHWCCQSPTPDYHYCKMYVKDSHCD